MNCLKKHPKHFSLNLGKLHNGGNGHNPEINYFRLYNESDISDLKIDTKIFQEFVIDCCCLTDKDLLLKFLDKLSALLKEDFTVRTLLVKEDIHTQTLLKFLNNIRIIESENLSALKHFPAYKIRLACKSLKEILSAQDEFYYIYRNPLAQEMLLPFALIKQVQTAKYNISYYKDGSFIYSVYRENPQNIK